MDFEQLKKKIIGLNDLVKYNVKASQNSISQKFVKKKQKRSPEFRQSKEKTDPECVSKQYNKISF